MRLILLRLIRRGIHEDDRLRIQAFEPKGQGLLGFFPRLQVRGKVLESELDTGRRSEGVITSAVTFASKCAYALGTFLGGVTLSLIEFPTETAVRDVAPDIIFDLGLVYGPLILVILLGSVYAISRYPISRVQHEEAVARLEGR